MDKIINIALVGYGYWGPNYARIISGLEDANLKWICDLNSEVLKKAKQMFPDAQITNELGEALSDPDLSAIIIATPVKSHFGLARQALTAGKHVLVEKPLVTTITEAKEIYNYARKNRLRLMVGYTYLFHPAVKFMQELIQNGQLGKILSIMMRRTNLGPVRGDVNVLWDLAPHDLSILFSLIDSDIEFVQAAGTCVLNPVSEDIASINVKFKNGVFVDLLVNWLSPVKVREMVLVGAEKMLVFDDMRKVGPIHIYHKKVIDLVPGTALSYSQYRELSSFESDVEVVDIAKNEPLKEEVISFLRSLNQSTVVNPEEALTIKIIDTLQRAGRLLKSNS